MIAPQTELTVRQPELDETVEPPPALGPSRTSRVVYGCGYYVSYSVTLPAYWFASLVPRNSAVRRGFQDGASAAADAHERLQVQTAAAVEATREKVGGAYAQVATRVAQRVENVQDAIAERKYRRRVAMA